MFILCLCIFLRNVLLFSVLQKDGKIFINSREGKHSEEEGLKSVNLIQNRANYHRLLNVNNLGLLEVISCLWLDRVFV